MTVAAASTQAADDWINLATVSMTNAPPPSSPTVMSATATALTSRVTRRASMSPRAVLGGYRYRRPSSHQLQPQHQHERRDQPRRFHLGANGRRGYYIGHEENHPAKQGGAHFSYDYANNKIYLSGIKQGKWLIREVLDGEGDGPPLAFSIRAWRFESVGSKLVCLPRYVHCTIPAAARRGTRLGTELGATHLRPRHEYRTI